MKANDLKNMDLKTLQAEVVSLRQELFNLNMNINSGQVKDSSQFRKLRRRIAQALTCINQKESV